MAIVVSKAQEHRRALVLVRDLGEEVRSAAEKAKHARSANTRRIYRIAWDSFTTWCAAHGLPRLPAEASTVATYLSSRADQGRSVGTLETELSAIAAIHRDAGHPGPRGSREVRAVMAGIRRRMAKPPRQKAPVTIAEIQAIARALPDTLGGKRDRALLLVGLAAGLRRSELAGLQVADVDFGERGLTLRITRSKTDQEGQGAAVGVPAGKMPLTCPVRALRAWLDASGIAEGPVFREVRRDGRLVRPRPELDAAGEPTGREVGLSGAAVADVVKRACGRVGLDPARFGGHSLRAGMATVAHAAGKSPIAIAKQGRWSSLAMVARYVRPELFEDNAMEGVGL